MRGTEWITEMVMEMVLVMVMMVMKRPPPTPRRRGDDDVGDSPPLSGAPEQQDLTPFGENQELRRRHGLRQFGEN